MTRILNRGIFLITTAILAASPGEARDLSIEERVQAQKAIERVYYSHQIGDTRPLEGAVPHALLERKVETYLKQSVALDVFWETPVTSAMLRRELERMAGRTRMPDRLRQLYDVLGNDPFLIQECLARPALVDRLARNFFAYDTTIHARKRQEAESLREELAHGRLDPWSEHPDRKIATLVRADAAEATRGPDRRERSSSGLELQPEEFDRYRDRLPARVGEVGPVQEEREAFVTRVVLERTEDVMKVATFITPKLSWDQWWASIESDLDAASANPVATEDSPVPVPRADEPCPPDDVWESVFSDKPDPRSRHTAVWTGSLMIVWGGYNGVYLNTGGRYDPATDVWTPTSMTNAPSPRSGHTAVWTGSLMVVWGGYGPYADTGGRYDPATDVWTPTSTTNAPSPRGDHTAVWTGSLMIIFGGHNYPDYYYTGGRYDPATDTWTLISAALNGRASHTAVWTGTEMIVWGGISDLYETPEGNGARYDPATDTWSDVSEFNAPSGRAGHTAVWTGNLMVVWGGTDYSDTNTGGRYDPATDTWSSLSVINAPSARRGHTAAWTGSLMVVWGGVACPYTCSVHNTGGRYDPVTDTWSPASATNALSAREGHTAVWTGSLMIIWGGSGPSFLGSGARYDPATDAWTPTSTGNTPSDRQSHTAIWTGSLMVVWGGYDGSYLNTGGRYDTVTDTWSPTTTANAPTGRAYHTAVWTGSLMVVWGGDDGASPNTTGGRYDPIADAWSPMSTVGEYRRFSHTAVWTGSEMIVWGGNVGGNYVNTGGRYDPSADTWTPTSTTNAPAGRISHTAVWTGSLMIVWGGSGGPNLYLDTGGRYDPSSDTWAPTSTGASVPIAREAHTAVWTGAEMIVWGGRSCPYYCSGHYFGGRYVPSVDGWGSLGAVNPPTARYSHTAVWTGSLMVIWGGSSWPSPGARYFPALGTWSPMSTVDAPAPRYGHTAVWTGNEMIVWGGSSGSTGGRYTAAPYVDGDLDGFSVCEGDCDDGRAVVHPGAGEFCDGLDNDCNGMVDGFPTGCGFGQCHRTGFCTAGVNSCVPGVPTDEVCDGLDNNCDGSADNIPVPIGSPSVEIDLVADSSVLGWQVLADATGYDVVAGDLATLLSTAGDFGLAIQACLADDLGENTLILEDSPTIGAAFFYLVRGVNCGGPGTYDSGDPAQVGSRDGEIEASYQSCRLPPFCGDWVCDPDEDHASCPSDCEFCPLCGG